MYACLVCVVTSKAIRLIETMQAQTTYIAIDS